MKYRVTIYDENGRTWIDFKNKPEMYKWLTKELNKDKRKEKTFEISQIMSDEDRIGDEK